MLSKHCRFLRKRQADLDFSLWELELTQGLAKLLQALKFHPFFPSIWKWGYMRVVDIYDWCMCKSPVSALDQPQVICGPVNSLCGQRMQKTKVGAEWVGGVVCAQWGNSSDNQDGRLSHCLRCLRVLPMAGTRQLEISLGWGAGHRSDEEVTSASSSWGCKQSKNDWLFTTLELGW